MPNLDARRQGVHLVTALQLVGHGTVLQVKVHQIGPVGDEKP